MLLLMMMRSFSWVSVKTTNPLYLTYCCSNLGHKIWNVYGCLSGLLCPLSYSEDKFECLGEFLDAFRSDFRRKFILTLVTVFRVLVLNNWPKPLVRARLFWFISKIKQIALIRKYSVILCKTMIIIWSSPKNEKQTYSDELDVKPHNVPRMGLVVFILKCLDHKSFSVIIHVDM